MPKARNINEQDLSMQKARNVNGWNAPKASKIIGKRKKPTLPYPYKNCDLEQESRMVFFRLREIGF